MAEDLKSRDFNDDVIHQVQSEKLDSNQMEMLIDKILEKYGESDVIGERPSTTDQSTSRDVMSEGNDVTEVPGIDRNRRAVDRRRMRSKGEDRAEEEEEGEIGGVIRSQKGVTKQLIEVSEGLDELNGDLERMKRELERVKLNAYVDRQQDKKEAKQRHADGQQQGHDSGLGDLTYGTLRRNSREWTDERKERVKNDWRSEVNEDDDVTDRRCYGNEWIEERKGVFRLGRNRDVFHLEARKTPFSVDASPLPPVPGRRREQHSRGDDVQMTHLLTIAESRWERGRGEGVGGDWTLVHNDRFGRTTTDEGAFTLAADDSVSSSSGVHKRQPKDGYCYMCEEFEDRGGGSGWTQGDASSEDLLQSSGAFHRNWIDDSSQRQRTKHQSDLLRTDSGSNYSLLRSSVHHHHHHRRRRRQPLTSSYPTPRIQIQKPESAEFRSRFLTKVRLKRNIANKTLCKESGLL